MVSSRDTCTHTHTYTHTHIHAHVIEKVLDEGRPFLGLSQFEPNSTWVGTRVGQNRIYTPYMTVYLVISLPKIPYIHRIYMVLARTVYIHRI